MPTILVIDDEPAMLQGLITLLELKEHTVLSAKDGREGLGIIQKYKLDLIISDLKMPKMSGLELLSVIRMDANSIYFTQCFCH